MAANPIRPSGGSGDKPRSKGGKAQPQPQQPPAESPMADTPTHPSPSSEDPAKTPLATTGNTPSPRDTIANSDVVAPPDEFESPREQPIVKTDPHRDLHPDEHEATFNEYQTPGEHLDLHALHGHVAPGFVAVAPEGLGVSTSHTRTAGHFRPVPWWAIAASAVLLMWGGIYLGQYNGGFQGDVFNEEANYHPVSGPPVDPNSPEAMSAAGEKLFTVNCVQCHQANGMGQAGQFPPLVGSEWVVGDAPKRLQQILLHGIQGTIHVKGAVYNNNMPNWNVALTDKQIAQVLTYVRHKLGGNSAEPITEKQMADARKLTTSRSDPWTETELLAIPTGPIDGGAPAAAATTGAAAQPGPGQNPPTDATGNTKPAAAPLGQGPATPPPTPAP